MGAIQDRRKLFYGGGAGGGRVRASQNVRHPEKLNKKR